MCPFASISAGPVTDGGDEVDRPENGDCSDSQRGLSSFRGRLTGIAVFFNNVYCFYCFVVVVGVGAVVCGMRCPHELEWGSRCVLGLEQLI